MKGINVHHIWNLCDALPEKWEMGKGKEIMNMVRFSILKSTQSRGIGVLTDLEEFDALSASSVAALQVLRLSVSHFCGSNRVQ